MTENHLRTSLRDWADETPAGEPPIDDLITRGTRRRRRRTATRLSVAALVTVAAATAAGIGVTASAGRNPATPAVSSAPDRPALTLAAALTSTTSTSFRYQADLVQPKRSGEPGTEKSHCSGVIDPATRSGYSKYGLTEHWVVNGVRYLKEGNQRHVLGPGDAAEFLTCGGTRAGHGLLSADPLTLLANLKEVSSVRQGDAAYAFSSPALSGTVTVREGRVSSMTVRIDTPDQRRDVTMTLSDYGVEVSRKAPW